jgi:hypothetical protein
MSRLLLVAALSSFALACAAPPAPTRPAPAPVTATAPSALRTPGAPVTVKRVILSLGRPSGISTTTADDGTVHARR